MNLKQLFNRHYRRLVIEGVLRSALLGVAVGFTVGAALGLLEWLLGFGGVWLTVGAGVGVAALAGVLAYFLKYKPSAKEVARRIDRLGLEERTITMLELEGDSSYLASVQRENAIEHIKKAENRKIRFRIPKILIYPAIAAFILCSSMTTVVGLAEEGVIPSGGELLPPDPAELPVAVSYMVDEGGEIIGETDQLVYKGEDTTPVVAVADDGWVFVGWDDGVADPERSEKNVQKDMIFIAIFEEIAEGEGGESGDDAESKPGSGEEDSAEDVPAGGETSGSSDQNGAGDKGDGQGSDGNSDGGQGSSEDQGEGKGDGQGAGAGGKWQESNQFIDGQTYYKEYLEMYYQYALEIFEENGEIPPELREFYEAYIESI